MVKIILVCNIVVPFTIANVTNKECIYLEIIDKCFENIIMLGTIETVCQSYSEIRLGFEISFVPWGISSGVL